MKKDDFKLKDNELLPCPFCGGKLKMFISDDTASRFCNGDPCWGGGATCPRCGIGIHTGTGMGGVSVEAMESYTIEALNRRPNKRKTGG